MSTWTKIEIGALCDIKHGYAFKSEHFSEAGDFILLTPGNFHEKGGLKLKGDKEKFYVGEIPESYKLSEGDLLIVMTDLIQNAPILGGAALVPEDEKYLHNQRLGKVVEIKSEVVDKKFLYYIFNAEVYRAQVRGSATGATVRHTAPERIKKCKIDLPPLPTQRRIASILSAYDDLIENNLRRIKLLEEAVQHIYREWFVRMRFPGWEGVRFGEDGLPEGWRRVPIKEFGTVITGKTPSTSISSFYGGDIMFVKTPDMHSNVFTIKTEARLTEEGALSQSNKLLPPFSVMVSCIGTAGVVSITSEQCQTNQQINSVTFDSIDKSLFFYNFSKGLKPLLEGLGSNGATFVNVNKGKFENIEITNPETSLLKAYGEVSKPIFDQILTLQKQNLVLQEARDILLPRLMNQTIEI